MFHATTILCVRKNNSVAIGGDGQETLGNTVMKQNAKKIRKMYGDKVLAGFAGATADAFTLFEKFEGKLESYRGNITPAAVELAKDWRTDKILRRLEALLIVADRDHTFIISGTGDVLEPEGSLGGKLVDHVSHLAKNELGIFVFRGTTVYVARTGYTGADGFEVVAPAEALEQIWAAGLEAGQPLGLQPGGLGARGTLRTEMCYPLYGYELTEDITPLEAGLGVFVALDKGEFTGRLALLAQKAKGLDRKCVAFTMSEKSAPPRPHYAIWSTGTQPAPVGQVSSGTQSPSLGLGVGLGYVPPALAQPGLLQTAGDWLHQTLSSAWLGGVGMLALIMRGTLAWQDPPVAPLADSSAGYDRAYKSVAAGLKKVTDAAWRKKVPLT